MPKTMGKVRVHNPGKKRKLTAKQIRFFGTKRQKAALKAKGHKKRTRNAGTYSVGGYTGKPRNRKVKKALKKGNTLKAMYHGLTSAARAGARKKREGNPGEIITLTGLAGNPGIRKGKKIMAKRKRKSTTRRRANAGVKTVIRYRTHARRKTHRRRHNPGYAVRRRVSHRRRRNPGLLTGGVGMLVGIFGGAALTGVLSSRLPAGLNTGIAGYITTGIVAYAQGAIAGKLLKNAALGKNLTMGGLIYLGLKVAGDLIPGLQLPFGLSGLGAIAMRDPYTVPQVPAGNSMISFLPTSNAPVIAATKGMGRIARMGRMN